MKRIYFLTVFFLITVASINLVAQQKTFMERVTLEAGGGFNLPLTPDSDKSASDFSNFRNFNVGANYELTDLFGLRLTYANSMFKDDDNSSMGLTLHRFMAEATFNIIEWIEMSRNPFEVILHGGAGISLGKRKQASGIDKMGTVQIGLMPLYRITNNFSVYADASYVLNISQDYFYNGIGSIKADGSEVSGEYTMLNLGLGLRYSF